MYNRIVHYKKKMKKKKSFGLLANLTDLNLELHPFLSLYRGTI